MLPPPALRCSSTGDSEMCFYGPDSPLTQSPRTASLASLLACLMSPNCASAPPATFPIFVFEVAQAENHGAPAEDWLTVHNYGVLSQGTLSCPVEFRLGWTTSFEQGNTSGSMSFQGEALKNLCALLSPAAAPMTGNIQAEATPSARAVGRRPCGTEPRPTHGAHSVGK